MQSQKWWSDGKLTQNFAKLKLPHSAYDTSPPPQHLLSHLSLISVLSCLVSVSFCLVSVSLSCLGLGLVQSILSRLVESSHLVVLLSCLFLVFCLISFCLISFCLVLSHFVSSVTVLGSGYSRWSFVSLLLSLSKTKLSSLLCIYWCLVAHVGITTSKMEVGPGSTSNAIIALDCNPRISLVRTHRWRRHNQRLWWLCSRWVAGQHF